MVLLTVVLAVAGAVAGAVAATLPASPEHPGPGTVVVLGAYLTITSMLQIPLHTGRQRDLINLTEVALAPALVLLPGDLLVLLVAVVKAGVSCLRRLPPVKVAFNAAQWAAATAAGSVVLTALRADGPLLAPQLPLLAVALLAVTVVNAAATLAVLGLAQHRPLHRVLGSHAGDWLRASGLDLAVALTFGALFVASWTWAPATSALVLVAIVLIHLGARALATDRVAHARLLGLQQAHLALTGAVDPRPAIPRFLEQLRLAFGCRGAVLHLVAADGSADHRVLRSSPPPARHPGEEATPEEATAEEAALVDLLLPTTGPGRWPTRSSAPAVARALAALGWRDCLSAPVQVAGRPVGLLVTYDRGGLEGFESGELAVLEAAASILGQALHRGELAEVVLAERAGLRRSEARWRSLVRNAPDLLVVTDGQGRLTYASPSTARLTGRGEHELLGRHVSELVHPDDAGALRDLPAAAGDRPGRREDLRLRLRGPGHAHRHLDVVLADLRDEPSVGGFVLNGRDVTERHRAEEAQAGQALVLEQVAGGNDLDQTLHLLAAVTEAQDDGARCAIALVRGGRLVLVARPQLPAAALGALQSLTAAVLAAGAGERCPVLVDLAAEEQPWRVALLEAGVRSVAVHPLTAGGPGQVAGAVVLCHRRPAAPHTPFVDAAVRLAGIAVSTDATRHHLAHQAAHDPLTDLPNRSVFLDRLTQALEATERSGDSALVLFLDLDRFKTINDSLGHRAGDTLLRAVAERLRQAVRPGDTIARFGGDEFTMLCEGIRDEAHAVELVDRVHDVLRRPFSLAGQEVFVTTSIGLALGSGRRSRAETLLENADAAMYRAKERSGTSYEIFDEAMRTRAVRRLHLLSALNRAVEERQFRVHYQPTVSLRTGAVLGAEALVRWEHPDRGLLPPSEFVPLAEESGLIVPIGAQVLEEAMHQAGRWNRAPAGPDRLGVSVNLSAAQICHHDLLAQVRTSLAASGADPSTITLEITESALIDDVPTSAAVLTALKDLGLRLVIDDFGTGWSSLTYLQRFPIDGVKVDRSFVAGLDRPDGDEAIVRAVVSLAHSLDLLVVAEGVETPEQLHRLVELDCEVAQGYWFGRPAPAGQVSLRRRPLPGDGGHGDGGCGDGGCGDGTLRRTARPPGRGR